jgi:hypothetical protein
MDGMNYRLMRMILTAAPARFGQFGDLATGKSSGSVARQIWQGRLASRDEEAPYNLRPEDGRLMPSSVTMAATLLQG